MLCFASDLGRTFSKPISTRISCAEILIDSLENSRVQAVAPRRDLLRGDLLREGALTHGLRGGHPKTTPRAAFLSAGALVQSL